MASQNYFDTLFDSYDDDCQIGTRTEEEEEAEYLKMVEAWETEDEDFEPEEEEAFGCEIEEDWIQY